MKGGRSVTVIIQIAKNQIRRFICSVDVYCQYDLDPSIFRPLRNYWSTTSRPGTLIGSVYAAVGRERVDLATEQSGDCTNATALRKCLKEITQGIAYLGCSRKGQLWCVDDVR